MELGDEQNGKAEKFKGTICTRKRTLKRKEERGKFFFGLGTNEKQKKGYFYCCSNPNNAITIQSRNGIFELRERVREQFKKRNRKEKRNRDEG